MQINTLAQVMFLPAKKHLTICFAPVFQAKTTSLKAVRASIKMIA